MHEFKYQYAQESQIIFCICRQYGKFICVPLRFLDELKADPENNIGIPEMDVLGMLLNLLVTLDAMHSAGILHTAITPLDIILLKNSFKTVRRGKFSKQPGNTLSLRQGMHKSQYRNSPVRHCCRKTTHIESRSEIVGDNGIITLKKVCGFFARSAEKTCATLKICEVSFPSFTIYDCVSPICF